MANPEHLKILKQTVEVPHAFKLAKYGVRGPEGDFGGVWWWKGDLSLAIRWAGRAWRLTGFPLNVKGKGRPSRDMRARVDTTCDRSVALWFATHNCGAEADG